MNKLIMILPVMALTFSQVYAVDNRDTVRNEILKSLNEAVQARQASIDELQESVKSVDAARAAREDDGSVENTSKSIGTQIVESREIAKISHSVANVEIVKIEANDKIIGAIVKVEHKTSHEASPAQIEEEKVQAVKKIAKAVSSVEIAKEHAKQTIIHAAENVEISKMQKTASLTDDAAAVKIAKNRSAVQIAKAVSAVEISKSVSKVKLAKILLDENVSLTLKEKYRDLTLEEIKAKAKAEISTIMAAMEVRRAKSLADIAKIVSFVEIAKAIDGQKKQPEIEKKTENQRETYSREFIRMVK